MTSDRVIFTVVLILGVFALLGLGGVIWLISVESPPASVAVVSGLCGTALGSFATLLASTRSGSEPAQDVNVVNDPANPAELADIAEGRAAQAIPVGDRTAHEQHHADMKVIADDTGAAPTDTPDPSPVE